MRWVGVWWSSGVAGQFQELLCCPLFVEHYLKGSFFLYVSYLFRFHTFKKLKVHIKGRRLGGGGGVATAPLAIFCQDFDLVGKCSKVSNVSN